MISRLWNWLLIKYYKISVGTGFSCDGRMVIQGHGKYKIGNNVHIISKEFLNPIGGNRTVLQTINNGKIQIGNNVGISHAVLCARESIIVEDNVLLGGGVKIFDNDFHPIEYTYRVENQNEYIKAREVKIEEGVFIGAHSIILKGVTIGRHSVIGAGSVVTKNVPDGEVWAGNPARFIKKID